MRLSAELVLALGLAQGAYAAYKTAPVAVACLNVRFLFSDLHSSSNPTSYLGQVGTGEAAEQCRGFMYALISQSASQEVVRVTCANVISRRESFYVMPAGVTDAMVMADRRQQQADGSWLRPGECLPCPKGGPLLKAGSCGSPNSCAVYHLQNYTWPNEMALNLREGTYLPTAAGLEDWMQGIGELRCSGKGWPVLSGADSIERIWMSRDLSDTVFSSCMLKYKECVDAGMADCEKVDSCRRLAAWFNNEGATLYAELCADIRADVYPSIDEARRAIGEVFRWSPEESQAFMHQFLDTVHPLAVWPKFVEVELKSRLTSQLWRMGGLGGLLGGLLKRHFLQLKDPAYGGFEDRQFVPLGGAFYDWKVAEALAFFDGIVAGVLGQSESWLGRLERAEYEPHAVGPVASRYKLHLVEKHMEREGEILGAGARPFWSHDVQGSVGGSIRTLKEHTLVVVVPMRDVETVKGDLPVARNGETAEALGDGEWERIMQFAAAGLRLGYALYDAEEDFAEWFVVDGLREELAVRHQSRRSERRSDLDSDQDTDEGSYQGMDEESASWSD